MKGMARFSWASDWMAVGPSILEMGASVKERDDD